MMRIEMNRGKHTQYTTSVYHELSIFFFFDRANGNKIAKEICMREFLNWIQ